MSEQVGADLPEARDGEGQLSKDALRSPARRQGTVGYRLQVPDLSKERERQLSAGAFTR